MSLSCVFIFVRQRVKEKIARDREERAQKVQYRHLSCSAVISHYSYWNQSFFIQFGGGGSTATSTQPAETSQGPPPTKKEYDESRIQVQPCFKPVLVYTSLMISV